MNKNRDFSYSDFSAFFRSFYGDQYCAFTSQSIVIRAIEYSGYFDEKVHEVHEKRLGEQTDRWYDNRENL